MSVSVTLDTKGLDALLAHWDAGVAAILDKVAADVLAESQRTVPVVTGNLKNSGQVEPGDDQYSRYIHYQAEYAAYVEFGTRFFSGRFYLTPAVEHHRNDLQKDFKSFFGSLVEK